MRKLLGIFLSGVLCFTSNLFAQNQTEPLTKVQLNSQHFCGFNLIAQHEDFPYEQVVKNYETILEDHKFSQSQFKTTNNVVYRIPVVVHIVYNASQPNFNLDDSIIYNQIDVLNKAFRHQHNDTGNTRNIFKHLAGDAGIEFYLAKLDPNGAPTSGITRTITTRSHFGTTTPNMDSFENIKKSNRGGVDPWPTDKYLNIWIGNLSNAQGQLSVLGYAIPPLNPIPPNWPNGTSYGLRNMIDGVVLQVHAVGSNNSLSSHINGTYEKGRCGVHEVGHYMGLMHTFGSGDGATSSDCGKAIINDGINDTPEQSLISRTNMKRCPTASKNSCGSGPNDLPDMWENYMDYVEDKCQTMFTHDQITIMRNVIMNQRSSMANVKMTSIEEWEPNQTSTLYPNPAQSQFFIQQSNHAIQTIRIVNIAGQLVKQQSHDLEKGIYIGELTNGVYQILMSDEHGQTIVEKLLIAR